MDSTTVDRSNGNARNAVRIALATAALCSGAAYGADADAPIEEIIVTGSRIAAANMASTSPILTVTSDEINTGGRIDLSDMLNQLPQINANYLGQDLGTRPAVCRPQVASPPPACAGWAPTARWCWSMVAGWAPALLRS